MIFSLSSFWEKYLDQVVKIRKFKYLFFSNNSSKIGLKRNRCSHIFHAK